MEVCDILHFFLTDLAKNKHQLWFQAAKKQQIIPLEEPEPEVGRGFCLKNGQKDSSIMKMVAIFISLDQLIGWMTDCFHSCCSDWGGM